MVDVNKGSLVMTNTFESLCNKLACLVYSRTDGDKKILSHILDSLNTLDYNLFHVKKEKGVLLINQCCYLIPPDETSLALKAINLFTNLIFKGCTIVEGKTLSLALDWCLQCLKNGNQVIVLKCLQALAKRNGKKIDEQNNFILAEIIKLSDDFSFSPQSEEVCLNCLRYIEALTFPTDSNDDVLPSDSVVQYFEIFKNILFKGKSSVVQNEIMFCKFLITAMRGICNLIYVSDEIIMNHLNEVLGIIKGYMLYGLLGHENYQIQKLFPTSTTVPEVLKSSLQSVKKLRGKYDRRSKKVTVSSLTSVEETDFEQYFSYSGYSDSNFQNNSQLISTGLQTSDSDFSDNEYTQNTKIKSYESKVRHCALILLGTVVEKTNPKTFLAYLPSFIPDGPDFLHMRTLITCMLEDPYPRCRSEALRVLLIIISNSRQYFLQADGLSKSSFTAFSCTISNTLKELHKCLLMTLAKEKNTAALKNLLKCFSDLIRCTPYHKVDSNLLINIAKGVEPFLKHRDVNIRIFSLTVFGCLISIEPKCKEIGYIVSNMSAASKQSIYCDNSDVGVNIDDLDVYEEEEPDPTGEKPWLLTQCINNVTNQSRLSDTSTNIALQIESLQVIGALSRNFFRETVVNFPNDIITLLKYCSSKDEYLIRLYSGKLMETVLSALQFGFSSDDESKSAPISLATRLWEELLPGPITSLIQDQNEPMLRCTGCDCLANVGVQVQNSPNRSVQNSLIFDQLPRDKQIMCMTLLFSCLRDESPAVRSSAARALAIFVMFPSLNPDSLFLLDVVDATTAAAKDEENTVRTQASWLYGNLSEAIISNREKEIDDGVTPEIILKLLKTGISLACNGPKMKPGAVRGIGNLLKIIDEDFMGKNKDVVVQSLEALIKNATTGTFMKARWNSCYAIANILQNPLIHSNNEWMSKIFNVMISLVQHYKNFKVRISAGLVLAVVPTRQSYGDFYNSIWSAALNALENSKNISDFNEYQHRDQLVDQICMILCHLISLLEASDLSSLQDVLYFHLDNLSHFMTKFNERLVPEKSNILLSATDKINVLLDEKGLTPEEKSLLRVLQNILIRDD